MQSIVRAKTQAKKHMKRIGIPLLLTLSILFSHQQLSAANSAIIDQVDLTCRSKCSGQKGPPACCGKLNNFASFQLFLLPEQKIKKVAPHHAIKFQREVVNKGFSIKSSPPFRTFTLVPGIYEITLGISTDAQINQVQLHVGKEVFTFTPYAVASDFITYAKTIEIFTPTKVHVTTTKGVSFSPGNSVRLAAYINFIRTD